MTNKKIIPYINAEGEVARNVIKLAKHYSNGGADELILYHYAKDEKSRDEFLSLAKELAKEVDIPFVIGTYIKRLEDVKKAFYTGAAAVLVKYSSLADKTVLKEAVERFGANKVIVAFDLKECMEMEPDNPLSSLAQLGAKRVILMNIERSEYTKQMIENAPFSVIIWDSFVRNDVISLMQLSTVEGITTNFFENKDIMKAKLAFKENGLNVNTFESKIPFSEFKLDSNGLLPVVVQDYKSNEVLMLAYMNEEAYNKTIAGGKMTYYSRSRQTLWLKGETSGHYQILKELTIDCDKDTILAKVLQIGSACHTGNPSCFFTELVKKEYHNYDPFHVFQDVYDVILDRRKHPKEGSYTNYLFDKGIDKILKKCGEEATEITIAAKNPGTEELRYEIADYLYHLMVLMAECDLDWSDITNELAHRK